VPGRPGDAFPGAGGEGRDGPALVASPLSHESGGRTPADAAALAAVPASLQAAIRKSPGTLVSAAGYSQQAELTASHLAAGDLFGFSVALSVLGSTALVGGPGISGTGARLRVHRRRPRLAGHAQRRRRWAPACSPSRDKAIHTMRTPWSSSETRSGGMEVQRAIHVR